MRQLTLIFFTLLSFGLFAQQNNSIFLTDSEGEGLQLQTELWETIIETIPHENDIWQGANGQRLTLPTPDGQIMTFEVWESPTMADGLANLYPEIKTFSGHAVGNPIIKIRFDQTYEGFHALISGSDGNRWMINPVDAQEGVYEFEEEREYNTPFNCQTDASDAGHAQENQTEGRGGVNYPIGDELRVYRMAVSTTGEFTSYHGGTVEGGLSAVVTILNRINQVYERDISARFELVDSNHLVIFLNANSDPFSGGDGQKMNTNQGVLDGAIGNSNYDIGHVFDVGGGGIANLQAVCNNNSKGRGFTSTSPPEGDFFAIDYAAHEIGHQFGGNHTFNNCGGDGPQPYEPGSATTIMGYAGLCGTNNVANNSDDHFHVISIEEMTQHSIAGNGYSCATIITDIQNTPPVITELPSLGLYIPLNTPFELTGMATDAEEDSLTYCWEQFDLGPSSTLGDPQGSAPSFRSFSPTPSPTRVFPRIQTILSNSNDINEVLPTYERMLNFRLTIRDNHAAGGGGVIWDDFGLVASESGGPFRVTTQNTPTTWIAGSFVTVSWNVANTDQAPISTDSVNIYLSTPGGQTYPYLLAGPIPNNGTASVVVPEALSGSGYRVKVKGHNNVFFDLNNAAIEIEAATTAGFDIGSAITDQQICAPDEAVYDFNTVTFLGFTDTLDYEVINLPTGLTASLSNTSGIPPLSNTLTVSGSDQVTTGNYDFSIVATNEDLSDTLHFSLFVVSSAPSQVFLTSPGDGETNVPTTPTLSWSNIPEADNYSLEVATDPGFSDILSSFSNITDTFYMIGNALPDSTQLFWRVSANSSICGPGETSVIRSFVTERIQCEIFTPTDTPVDFNSLPFIISRIEITDSIIIRDINFRNIQGTYSPVSGLEFRLRAPDANSSIDLLTDIDCNFGSSFNFSIDNDSPPAMPFDCPLSAGDTYLPEDGLESLSGTNAQGIWRLFVYDSGGAGQLTNWELEICANSDFFTSTKTPFEVLDIRVFPNPAGQVLQVELPSGESGDFIIYDMQGKEVLRKQINERGELIVGGLPAGSYVYRWWSAEGKKTGLGKFVRF